MRNIFSKKPGKEEPSSGDKALSPVHGHEKKEADSSGTESLKKTELLQKQLNNLYLVNELSQHITSSLSLEEGFGHLYSTINSMMDASAVELLVYGKDEERIFFSNKSYPDTDSLLTTYNHMSEWSFKNKKEIFLEDAEIDYGRYVFKPLTLPDGSAARSVMVFPVLHHDKITGTLSIVSFTKNAFELFHKEMIRLLLPFIGVAIDNAFKHQQIISLKQRAERSEQFMQEFLSNMSHEIRTPMNAVMGMTNILLQKNPQQEQLKYLDAIQRSSENLLVILNDILDLSKIEAGKIELEHIDFSLREVIASVKSILLHKAEEKGLELTTGISEKIPDILVGDPTRLTQVLINLLGNAIKFTEKGSVRLDVQQANNSEMNQQANQQLLFHVSDTGIGISPQQQEKLFSKYSQAGSETTRKYGGTGLGLNISKQLVQLQGGTIRVESVPGKGSTFSVSLLFPESESKVLTKKKAVSQEMLQTLEGKRILIADDNEYNRITIAETLKLKIRDIRVDEAQDGEQALEMFARNAYDIVIMDLIMPKVDGVEAARIIRNSMPADKKNIPIVALTASVIKSEIEKCYTVGMNGYIQKPFQEYQLFSSLVHALMNKGIPSGSGEAAPAMARNGNRVIDMDSLNEFTEGDAVRMQRFVEQFLTKIPVYVETLHEKIGASDFDSVRIAAHSMKPLLQMLGIQKGVELTEHVEQCCVTKLGLDQLPSLISQVDDICHQAVVELKRI